MADPRKLTEEQKEKWKEKAYLQESQMKEMIQELASSWQEKPETIAEIVRFWKQNVPIFGTKYYVDL